ncbi:MAG: amidohydrolase [SAR202 cluster bacterium]|nr:amidohydrolase [SAR202 cluster bacterium]
MAKIVDTPVIDVHAHVGQWGAKFRPASPKMYVDIMDAAGVDRMGFNCIYFDDERKSHNVVADWVSKYPDRFIGVAFGTPRHPDETIPELERAFDQLGFKYMKIYPTYYTKPVDDPSYDLIFEWANSRGIVIMCHSSNVADWDTLTLPTKFIGLAKRFTKVKWLLAHSGNAMRGQVLAVEAAKQCPNIYLEICTSFAEAGTIEFLVNGAGEDRVLFGSDIPLMDPRYHVGRVVTADISEAAKQKVLGLNAKKLLGL